MAYTLFMKKQGIISNIAGFGLVEIVCTLAIAALFLSFAILGAFRYIDMARKTECELYRQALLQETRLHEALHGVFEAQAENAVFSQGRRIYTCPSGGVYTYCDGEWICSVHNKK